MDFSDAGVSCFNAMYDVCVLFSSYGGLAFKRSLNFWKIITNLSVTSKMILAVWLMCEFHQLKLFLSYDDKNQTKFENKICYDN